ncbi:glycoside hydrolase family 3 C-terminal domain-containing protein [Prolixibacteraceae bacterium Z1-6]|uniref:Glycoside hydrolase family 3 C-terminal domain-containing protein n=1 Tax=Draconibacterium aestuarii TaxID=2998507 RepID=A0A9X3F7U0_9BACT|nr:glycoside hydrolase family 3 C-terminal domain-containing protein [Prolixibacteraceae bacterium Z1-6]
MRKTILNLFLLLFSATTFAQNENFEFLNPDLPFGERVDILVSQMTVQEKIDQLIYTSKAVDRLQIPEYNWWNECLHGVARAGYATVFPQSITIAGSWDQDLMYRVATAISDEARAKHHEFIRKGKRGIYQGLTFWSPNINIFRDPRWGRGHETYGEDPYLTGILGAEFVKGLQGDDPKYLKVVATAKHYAVHSGPEPLRHEFNAKVSELDLRETYLPAFRTLVKDADVYSVMGAYNQFRDFPCCASPELFSILRNDWGFKGYVVSDCWAISDFYQYQDFSEGPAEAAAAAVRVGTDLNCGSAYAHLPEAVKKGLLTEEELDVAVKRLMMARFKLGMFDSEKDVAYAQIPFSVNTSAENDKLALEAARKSIVLLKNEDNILPLSKDIKKLAVIGPNADNWESLVGNYNGIAKNPVTVYEGLKNKLKNTKVLYAEGSHLAEGVSNLYAIPSKYLMTADGKQGVVGEYFNTAKLEGEPVFTRIDKDINFYWESDAPAPELNDDDFSVRWTGYIVPPVSGTYNIGCWGMPTLDIWFEGEKILSHNSKHHAFYHEKAIDLEVGKKYKFVYEYKNTHGDGDAKLMWTMPNTNMLQEAVEAVKQAEAVVLVLGLSQRLEGEEMPIKVDGFEGGDRTHLKLPETQRELMRTIEAIGKPIILVLLNGSALAVNWADENLEAIISAGYPGQEGGNAVADVLFGDYNPAGRLPVTYYKSVEQLPSFEDYNMAGRTYKYFEGDPLYPFGFGLSYTNFEYSNLKVAKKVKIGEKVSVSINITNTGDKDGEEVVQLYIKDEVASTLRPKIQLEGFKRIFIKAGDSKTVEFELEPRQFSIIGAEDKRVIESGNFIVFVGGGQPGVKASNVVSAKVELTGENKYID